MKPHPEDSTPRRKPPNARRCQHLDAARRRCRSFPVSAEIPFCAHHLRLAVERSEDTASHTAELLGPLQDFTTATAVNRVLGNLLELIADGRIPGRRAAIVAYTCQLLLSSLPAVKDELHDAEVERQRALWRQNPQPLPATPQAFANAVFERVLGTKIPSANLAPAARHQSPDLTNTPPRNLIK